MNISRILFLFLILSTAWSAHATLTFSAAPSGVSNYVTKAVGTSEKDTIYGGRAEDAVDNICSKDGLNNSTCDTCTGLGLFPCNKNSVYPELKVHFQILSSVTLPTTTAVLVKNANGDNFTYSTAATVTGTSVSLYLTWAELCSLIGSSDCATDSATSTITIGVDTAGGTTLTDSLVLNVVFSPIVAGSASTLREYTDCAAGSPGGNFGYCHVKFARGDEKVYIDEELYADTNYPSSPNTGVDYSSLVFFYATSTVGSESATLASIVNNSASFTIPISTVVTPPTISDNRITGLTNDVLYCFVMANQDAAGNIFYFTPSSASSADLCATPTKVVGLLDDKHCFIATAAFGSDMAPEVNIFRHFRNEYLLNTSWGQTLVKIYYKFSPPVANFISQNEILRTSARVALWPLLIFAKTSLHFGIWLTLFTFLLGSLLLTLFVKRIRKT